MPNSTTHYELMKPLPSEAYNIEQFNANADKIDAALFKKVELGTDGKLPKNVMPDLDYITLADKGKASGVASLDVDGKVPKAQVPSLDYIPSTEKAVAGGVASLGADGKVMASQLPEDIDCGTFDDLTPVAAHNISPAAHQAMVVDGNAISETGKGGDLVTHETDPLAHQNIILDGNLN